MAYTELDEKEHEDKLEVDTRDMVTDLPDNKKTNINLMLIISGIALLLVIFSGVLIFAITSVYYKNHPTLKEVVVTEKVEVDPIVIEKELQISAETVRSGLRDIGNLETAEYYFTHVINNESQLQYEGINIPFTKSQYIYSYDGSVTAGVDFTGIEVEVDNESKSILVTVPEAEILGCEIEEDSFTLYNEDESIFNPIELEDFARSREVMAKDEEEKAIKKGILKDANSNAELLIENFMHGLYDVNGYDVTIQRKTNS